MSKVKRYIYAPHTVVLDIKKQPDAEAMLRIAKATKGVKIEVIKSGHTVAIHYPDMEKKSHIQARVSLGKTFPRERNIELVRLILGRKKEKNQQTDGSKDARLYHAMILK